MNDELIKEITIALIEKDVLYIDGKDNKERAKTIADFINTLRDELNK